MLLEQDPTVQRNPKTAPPRNALAMGRAYVARNDVNALVGDFDDAVIPKGTEIVTTQKFDEVVDAATGEVYRLPLHVARNKEWYFHRAGLNDTLPFVDQEEYTRELVRGSPGLNRAELWDIATKENFGPTNGFSHIDSFSAALSRIPSIEMHDPDGNVVKGIKHRKTNNTYWPKGASKK